MERSTLFSLMAVFGISFVGFKLLAGQSGFLDLIHSACFIGLFYSGIFLALALLGSMFELFTEHKSDHTRLFCPQCGEEVFPEVGNLWSRCSSWKCDKCGTTGGRNETRRSAIEIPPNCWEVKRERISNEIEECRRKWDDEHNKPPPPTINQLIKSAEQGNKLDQYSLGEKLANGDGIPKNPPEALKWYRKSAEQGYSPAQNKTGLMYYLVFAEPAEAIKWFRRAANQGDANSQYMLGLLHTEGNHVDAPQNYIEAYKWFNLAAQRGDESAKWELNTIGKMMTSSQMIEALIQSKQFEPREEL